MLSVYLRIDARLLAAAQDAHAYICILGLPKFAHNLSNLLVRSCAVEHAWDWATYTNKYLLSNYSVAGFSKLQVHSIAFSGID